jgi:REP element-mobilizing transposase RayT
MARPGAAPGQLRFAKADRLLDQATTGPSDLREPPVAQIVEDAILFGVPERYELFARCVMANHVHVLVTPRWELAKITQGIKGFTSFAINRLHNQPGRTFWVDESYDHWVRDDEELLRIVSYIENNPVKAGLSAAPADWSWSSARYRSWWTRGEALKPDEIAKRTSARSGNNA